MKKIIIVEGVDRSGKNTLIDELNKYFKYKYYFINRLGLSNLVYSNLRGETIDTFDESVTFTSKHLTILLHVDDIEVINKRCIETNHELFDVKKHNELFKMYAYEHCNMLVNLPISLPIDEKIKRVEDFLISCSYYQ